MREIGKKIRNFLQLDTQELARRWRESRLKKEDAAEKASVKTPENLFDGGMSTTAAADALDVMKAKEATAAFSEKTASQIAGLDETPVNKKEPVAQAKSGICLEEKRSKDSTGGQTAWSREFPVSKKTKTPGMHVSASGFADTLKQRISETIASAVGTLVNFFPFEIAPAQKFEELPGASRFITGFLVASALGFVLSAGLMLFFRRRAPYFSLLSAAVVAVAVIMVFRGRTGFPVGVFAAGLALFSLVLGEMVAQLFHRAEIIRLVDVLGFPTGGKEGMLYRRYYFNLLVVRVLPAVVLSFLIGLWPFKKRIRYKGFQKP